MKTSRSGAAGPWFVLCLALLAGGIGLEFAADVAPAFWVGAKLGAAAAIGAGAAAFAVISANLARFILAGRGERSDDADRS